MRSSTRAARGHGTGHRRGGGGPGGGIGMGAGRHGDHPSRRRDHHRGVGPVHGQLHLLQRRRHVFIGQAAHCATTGASTDTNGCDARLPAHGAQRSQIDRRQPTGQLVYNSWMTDAGGRARPTRTLLGQRLGPGASIAAADVGQVNPTVPFFGGPTGLGTAPPRDRRRRLHLRQLVAARRGRSPLSPKRGASPGQLTTAAGPTPSTPVTPGIPGLRLRRSSTPRAAPSAC